jgi:hypothetical protein
MRTLTRLVSHLYLGLALLVGLPAGAHRSVICVAPNGHFAIEVGQGRCADYAPFTSASVENAGVSTTPDGCGDCIDVPVSAHVLSSNHHGTASASPRPPVATPLFAGRHDAEPYGSLVWLMPVFDSPIPPSFPPSRTTILRN